MPIYKFKCDCGETAQEKRRMADFDKPMNCACGKTMHRDIRAEHTRFRNTPGNWPMESYAAGVEPCEIPEMMKIDAEHGVPTDYSSEGDPILRSPQHRKDYCRAHDLFDRNAGYSDPAPLHR